MRGLFTSLVIHYWIGDVQVSQGVSASEMTYIVSGWALNSTHSLQDDTLYKLTQWQRRKIHVRQKSEFLAINLIAHRFS